jgi:hypothetical protein
MTRLIMKGEHEAPGRGPAGLAWDGTLLWNADYAAGSLFALDPDSGAVVNSFLCPGVLSGLAWDGSALWQGILEEGWLRKINPQTHDYDRTIVVPDHGRLAGICWDGQRLWAVSQQRGLILGIDRESGEVFRTIDIPVAAGGLAFRDNSFWVGYPDRMTFAAGRFIWDTPEPSFYVGRIDMTSGEELARYEVDFLPLGLAWVGDMLWVAVPSRHKLYEYHLP